MGTLTKLSKVITDLVSTCIFDNNPQARTQEAETLKAEKSDLQKRYEDGMKVLLGVKCVNLDKAIQTKVTLSGDPRVEAGGDLSARGCLESLTYSRRSSVEFCHPILDY